MAKPKPQKAYKNPIYTALEWKKLLDSGKYKSKAELARHLGISRVRVVQILNLLKLDQEILRVLISLGSTLSKPIVAEHNLRLLVNKPVKLQKIIINKILVK